MKFKAIIFDMDGTIIETDHIWKEANKELITKRGIALTPEIEEELSKKITGLALTESCKVIKNLVNLPDALEDLIKEKSAHADRLYANGVRFIDGFVAFHKKVIERNLKVGLATNATDQTLIITKTSLKLEQFFGEHMYNISHVNNLFKPNPALYLHAAKQLNISPSECIAIEDSAHGIKAARDAGMFCIGINTSKRQEQVANSHMIIEHYNDINLEELLMVTTLNNKQE